MPDKKFRHSWFEHLVWVINQIAEDTGVPGIPPRDKDLEKNILKNFDFGDSYGAVRFKNYQAAIMAVLFNPNVAIDGVSPSTIKYRLRYDEWVSTHLGYPGGYRKTAKHKEQRQKAFSEAVSNELMFPATALGNLVISENATLNAHLFGYDLPTNIDTFTMLVNQDQKPPNSDTKIALDEEESDDDYEPLPLEKRPLKRAKIKAKKKATEDGAVPVEDQEDEG